MKVPAATVAPIRADKCFLMLITPFLHETCSGPLPKLGLHYSSYRSATSRDIRHDGGAKRRGRGTRRGVRPAHTDGETPSLGLYLIDFPGGSKGVITLQLAMPLYKAC
jgi:hypothetical protein